MATTYTTNYNLGKQENHADKFDMDVITDNADKIDAALTGLQSSIDGKQATLTTAQLAAVNSGITSELVTQISTNTTAIAGKADASDVTTETTNLQSQIDNIITPVTQDAEVQNARVGVDGTSYATLKARLDTEENYIKDNHIAVIEDYISNAENTSGYTFVFGRVNGSGYIDTDYTNRICTEQFYYALKGSYLAVKPGYKFNVSRYSKPATHDFIESVSMRTEPYIFPADCFFRITLARTDDNDMQLTESSNFVSRVLKNTIDISRTFKEVTSSDVIWEQGRVNTNGTNDNNITTRIRTRDYIFCEKGSTITVTNGRFNVVEYQKNSASNGDFEVIGNKSLSSDSYTITRPCYIRITFAYLTDDHDITYLDYEAVRINLVLHLIQISNNKDNIVYVQRGKEVINPFNGTYHYTGVYYPHIQAPNRLEKLYAFWDGLVENYPNFVSKEVLGYDESEQFEIRCYTVCGTSEPKKQVKVLWIDAIHGHEYMIGSTTYQFIKDLLDNHYTNNALSTVWGNCCLKVIPAANPWGYENFSRVNSNGVNLNRNFSAEWELTPDDSSFNYSGATPDSEAETQIIQNFIWRNRDAVFVVNRHDMASVSDSSKYFGYAIDNFMIDKNILEAFSRKITVDLRKNNSWIEETTGYEKNPLFMTDYKTGNSGTLDKWVNKIGMHGCLLEMANSLGADFSESRIESVSRIQTDICMSLLTCIINNNLKMDSNLEQKYTYREEST